MSDGKVLFVTGASSDVGQGIIREMASNYDVIWAHYNSSDKAIEDLKEIYGGKIRGLKADLSNESEVMDMIRKITETGCFPDHIVHLAALKAINMQFHKCKWEDYSKGIDVSLRSIVLILEAFIPKMRKKKYGKIVFMLTSYVIGVPPKFQNPYVVVKYALLGLMRNLASEYADKGITVNAISPEMIETKFLSNLPDVVRESNADKMPIGRNLVVADVVPAFSYILSEGANVVTGQNLGVTGGRVG